MCVCAVLGHCACVRVLKLSRPDVYDECILGQINVLKPGRQNERRKNVKLFNSMTYNNT